MSERKHKRKRKNPDYPQNCYVCEHCVYVGEGGYICDMSNDVVIEDWQPTDDFYCCDGKDFEKI